MHLPEIVEFHEIPKTLLSLPTVVDLNDVPTVEYTPTRCIADDILYAAEEDEVGNLVCHLIREMKYFHIEPKVDDYFEVIDAITAHEHTDYILSLADLLMWLADQYVW